MKTEIKKSCCKIITSFFLLFLSFNGLSAKSPAYTEKTYYNGVWIISEYEEGFWDELPADLEEENALAKREKELTPEERQRLQELREAKERLKKAETEAVDTVKELLKLQKDREELEKKVEEVKKVLSGKDSPGSYDIGSEKAFIENYMKQKQEELKVKEQQESDMQEKLEKESEEVSECYKELAAIYEKYNMVGDPVDLKTGDFVCKYKEIIGLRKYSVGINESFGMNWTCPLDSRIVRFQGDDIKELNDLYKALLANYEKAYEKANKFHTEYNEYSCLGPIVDICSTLVRDLKICTQEADAFIETNDNSINLNAYATYGRFSDSNTYYGPPDIISYVDTEGNCYKCFYDGSSWVPVNNTIPGRKFRIYSMDEYGGIVGRKENKNGFAVVWDTGYVYYYNKYGILDHSIDIHNNFTRYYSEGPYVNRIQLPSGEMLSIERNQSGCIQAVTGTVSGTTRFFYTSDNQMYGYSNPDGRTVFYEYSEPQKLLHKIIKGDGTSVVIDYGDAPVNRTGRKSVSSITDENGNSEYFYYYQENEGKRIIHTTFDGINEDYICDRYGRVIYCKDEQGKEVYLCYNEAGLITEIMENGVSRKILYGFDYTPYQIVYDDGSTYSVTSEKGRIVQEIDRDGFSNEYKYNDTLDLISRGYCGNQISTMDYYPNGLLKKLEEGGFTYEYQYNPYGYPTKKVTKDDSLVIEENWSYDEHNRVIRYESSNGKYTNYSYSENEIKEINDNHLEIVHKFNSRGWEIETIEKDTNTGKTHVLKKVYDGRGNVTSVFLDGKIFTQYEYSRGGKLKSVVVWNLTDNQKYGERFDYIRDDKNRLVSEIVYQVDSQGIPISERNTRYENVYGKEGDRISISRTENGKKAVKYLYDAQYRLVSKNSSDNRSRDYSYSKAGRLVEDKGSGSRKKEYSYYGDGSTGLRITDGNNNCSSIYYDEKGNVTQKRSAGGRIINYQYNNYGDLLLVSDSSGSTEYEYDNRRQLISKTVKDRNAKVLYRADFIHDYNAKKSAVLENGMCSRKEKYDGWGRIVEKEDGNGKVFYEYDGLGNVILEKDDDGNIKRYEYTPLGDVLSITTNDSFVRKYEYYPDGKLKAVYDNGKKVAQYSYGPEGKISGFEDEFGNLRQVYYGENAQPQKALSYDNGITLYQIENSNRLKMMDSAGNENVYDFDSAGNCISIRNPAGKIKTFSFDMDGRVDAKKTFGGKKIKYFYDDAEGVKVTHYENDEDFVQRNALGNLIKAKNKNVSYVYDYDLAGRLRKVYEENTETSIFYDYDNWGNCTRKFNDLFDYNYTYDKLGRIVSIEESKSGVWVSCEYDNCSREIQRKYSSGITVNTDYDDYGRKCAVVAKNIFEQIIHADFIVYDERNRISCVYNQDGKFKEYEYYADGRLKSSKSPFSKEAVEFSLREGINCGLFDNIDNFSGDYYEIDSEKKLAALRIMERSGENVNLCQSELIWEEIFDYTDNGSIKSVKNPVYQINYIYNSLNQLIRKKGDNTEAEGMTFRWDDDGNLLEISSLYEKISFVYGNCNRPVLITVSDLRDNSNTEYTYTYDVFGRRFSEKSSSGISHVFLYDSLLNQLIADIPVFENNLPSSSYSYDWSQNAYFSESDSEYKILNQQEYNYSLQDSTVSKNYDGRPFSVLSLYGKAEIFIYKDLSNTNGFDSEFHLRDFRNNVVSVCTADSELIFQADYDVWGNLLGTIKGADYQYSVNSCNTRTNIYNLGKRDYIPEMKSFTTSDPVEYGSNWYGYSCGDCLNYCDFSGYMKKSLTLAQNALLMAEMCKYISYNHDMGKTLDIPDDYDCADVVSYIDAKSRDAAGLDNDTQTKKFYDYHNENNIKGAKDSVNSMDFYEEHNFNKTLDDGYDNDVYRLRASLDEDVVKENQEKKDDFFEAIKDPELLSVGTVIAFKTSEYHEMRGYNNGGHVIMVTARQFDADGNVIGFSYIEGHQSYDKKTNIGYIDLNATEGDFSLESYFGYVDGIYEMENPDDGSYCSN